MSGQYRYDGTLAGLLTLISHLLELRERPVNITAGPPFQQELFSAVVTIATDPVIAETCWAGLKKRLSPNSLKLLRRCLLADHPEQELLICRYLLLEAEKGKEIDNMLAHQDVAPVWKLSGQVGREAHRYLGITRFRQVDGGMFYADISPVHRILLLIASHFSERFHDQQWLIHDTAHKEGLLYDNNSKEWLLLPIETGQQPEITPDEKQFQALWRCYFNTLAITERKNLKLQQGKAPLRLRQWMTEFTCLNRI